MRIWRQRGKSIVVVAQRDNSRTLLTQDPIGLADGVNLYAYADGNPVAYSDPLGLCPACIVLALRAAPYAFALTKVAVEALDPNLDAGTALMQATASAARRTASAIHHIATDKNWVSTARGGPWSPRFEKLFERAGMAMNDVANKVRVAGHTGPHPEAYHRAVYDRLQEATRGLDGEAYRSALTKELEAIGKESGTPGERLNTLITR